MFNVNGGGVMSSPIKSPASTDTSQKKEISKV